MLKEEKGEEPHIKKRTRKMGTAMLLVLVSVLLTISFVGIMLIAEHFLLGKV